MNPASPRIVLLCSQRNQNLGDAAMCQAALRILSSEFGPTARFIVRGPNMTIVADGQTYQAKPIAAAVCPSITRWKAWWLSRNRRDNPQSSRQRQRDPGVERTVLWLGFLAWTVAAWLRVCLRLPLPAAAAELIDELSTADFVLTVGGGWVNSSFQLTLQESLFAMRVTQLRRRTPLMLLGDQFGPFSSNWDRSMIRRVFRSAILVGPRDEPSCQLVRDMGLPAERIKLFGDWAYVFHEPAPSAPLAGRPLRLAINLRLAHYSPVGREAVRKFAQALCALPQQLPLELVPVPMCFSDHEDDVAALGELSEAIRRCGVPHVTMLPIPTDGDAESMRQRIGTCDAAMGVSYHFCLFAMMSNRPCLGLSTSDYYSAKLSGLFAMFGSASEIVPLATDAPLAERFRDWLERLVSCQARVSQHNQRLSVELTTVRSQLFADARQLLCSTMKSVTQPITSGTIHDDREPDTAVECL